MAKKNKTPKKKVDVTGCKHPKNIANPNSYLNKNPSWSFSHCDQNGKWSIYKCENFNEDILKKLIGYEGMTWHEIMQSSGGRKSGTNSHFIPMNDICKEAQKRVHELYFDFDEIFSLRLSSRKRLFGSIHDGVFNIIWYDPTHEICPVKK